MCSEGLTTAAFPQKTAGKAFQATFGSGVLKLMISAGDTERLPDREHGPVRHARRRRAPVRAAALAGDEEPHLDGGVGLTERQLDRLPGLGGDELGRLLAPIAQEERELPHDVPSLDRRALRPGRLRRASRRHGRGDVVRSRARQAAEQGAVRGAQLVEPLA